MYRCVLQKRTWRIFFIGGLGAIALVHKPPMVTRVSNSDGRQSWTRAHAARQWTGRYDRCTSRICGVPGASYSDTTARGIGVNHSSEPFFLAMLQVG